MTADRVARPRGTSAPVSMAASAPGGLPDINAETYPFEVVQDLLDRAAHFCLYATSEAERRDRVGPASSRPDDFSTVNGGLGLEIGVDLRPFNSVVAPSGPPDVVYEVGDMAGRYRSRWTFAPLDFGWSPGVEPPATVFDPWFPQRFVMLGDRLSFGPDGRDGFLGYGVGRTFPGIVAGPHQLRIGAIGNITEGFGKFRGLEGTYTFNGHLARGLGFEGCLTCRVIDPDGVLHGKCRVAGTAGGQRLGNDATYLVLSGRKSSPQSRTEYGPPPQGMPGLTTLVPSAQMSIVRYRFSDRGDHGLCTEVTVDRVVANLDASVVLDLNAPPGTAGMPSPFVTRNVYTFFSPDGREVGTITAEVGLGLGFQLLFREAPGQQAMRIGGIGPIVDGTGTFQGARGLLSINTSLGIAPHALSMMHVLHITEDGRPGGRDAAKGQRQKGFAGTGSLPSAAPINATDQIRERDLVLRTGDRMHYRESGPPNGPPILMLHGNPASSLAWTKVMIKLSHLGRCIAPDLMGYGDSGKPDVPYSFYTHAEYLDDFVEGLGLQGITLFIQDWGGALGFDHAVRHRDNIRGIAFFEAILKPFETWEDFPQRLDRAKLERGDPQQVKSDLARQKFREFREGDVGGPGWRQAVEENVFLKVFMGPLLGHPFDPREIPDPLRDPVLGPLLEPYFRPFPSPQSRIPIWRLARMIPIAGFPPDMVSTVGHYSRVLARWDVPKLLIYSDKGPTLKKEHAQWVRENWKTNLTVRDLDQIPGITVVEGTHFLQQTHPEEIARFFKEWFVKSVARPGLG